MNRICPTCRQEKSIPRLLTQCFNCWYSSANQTDSHQALLDKINQDPNQAINWLYADAHSGQFFNHPEQTWEQLRVELQTERETTQQALRTGQEWHERQKGEIIEAKDLEINQIKQKLTGLIQQRKNQVQQEITLLKEILSHD